MHIIINLFSQHIFASDLDEVTNMLIARKLERFIYTTGMHRSVHNYA